ncbi:MAG: HPF/RaiA family ribosome-associated protein, partial [Oscillospiraceae bacterium]|nr:HPF/RaiA family ribosome-associated protein [Oscillospiraceae bacterium]
MKFVISGKNVEVTDTLYAAVESRLGKLDRYFSPETKCIVTLSLPLIRTTFTFSFSDVTGLKCSLATPL